MSQRLAVLAVEVPRLRVVTVVAVAALGPTSLEVLALDLRHRGPTVAVDFLGVRVLAVEAAALAVQVAHQPLMLVETEETERLLL